jgi:cyclopropane fatty-acyl-phospholipid synthase-like methyltransferase
MLRTILMTSPLLLSLACASSSEAPAAGHHGHGAPHDGPNAHHGHASGMPHRFEDAAAWSKQFDAPERDAWQKPDEVIAALALPKDAVVADVGAGTGYFAVRLARAVPQGRVLGVDVEADMVRFIDERAAKEGLTNLKGRLTPFDRAEVDDGTDLVLVVDTYHHIADRVAYFKALLPKLSARGRLAIVDFRPSSERGPPKAMKMAPEFVQQELAAAGYLQVESHDFLPDQYLLVFSPRR